MASNDNTIKFTDKLSESGITEKTAKKLGLKKLNSKETGKLTNSKFNTDSILIPYPFPNGKHSDFYRLRILLKGLKQKYTQPVGQIPKPYLPDLKSLGYKIDWIDVAKDKEQPIIITEGEFKAICGSLELGIPVLGLGGVWNWKSKKAKKPIIDELKKIKWDNRDVYIVFDSDSATNENVQMALIALSETLTEIGANVNIITIPVEDPDIKLGLDDYLMEYGANAFKGLIDIAMPFELSRSLWQINREVCFVRFPDSPKNTVVHRETGKMMSIEHFKNNYAPLKYYKPGKDDKMTVVGAASEWLKWPYRNESFEYVYKPGQGEIVETIEKEIKYLKYNKWKGWGYEPRKGTVKPWIDLMEFMFGDDKPARKWFEQWCAFQFQQPGIKMHSGCIFWGATHGTGKSLIGFTLSRIFGRNSVKVSHKLLTGDYDGFKKDKQFAFGDEITGVDKREEADQIKNLITSEEDFLNPKFGTQEECEIILNYFFTSNHPNALMLEPSDRRFFVWETPLITLPKTFYTKYVHNWLLKNGPSYLFDYLLNNIDLSDFDAFGPALKTSAKENMIDASKSDLGLFIGDLKEQPDSVLMIDNVSLKSDLYTVDQIRELAKAQTNMDRLTVNAVSREMTKHEFPKVESINIGGKIYRLRVVRNIKKWDKKTTKEKAEHYSAAHNIEKKKKY